MKQSYRPFIIVIGIIGLISIVAKTCMQVQSYDRTEAAITPPVHPADTATNCFSEKQDHHGYINRKWFWAGIEFGKYSEVRCFHIDTSGYSSLTATTGNWVIYNEGSMDVGGPAHWARCSYLIDEEKTKFSMFNFRDYPNDHDTIKLEILRLDDDYMILWNPDVKSSDLYMRRR